MRIVKSMSNMEKELHIAIVSNIILEPYFMPLANQYFDNRVTIEFIPFWEFTEDVHQAKLFRADLIVVWLNLEDICPRLYCGEEDNLFREIIILTEKLYAKLTSVSQAKILWFLFEDYTLLLTTVVGHVYSGLADKLNRKICDTLGKQVSFIDLKHLIAEVGISNAYNLKGKYRWNAPYSKVLVEMSIKEIYKQYLIEAGITKKCLVLDCDNVLWGGTIAEDGIENLRLSKNGLGAIYWNFQLFVSTLYYHGVVLAICSKNNLSDVLTVFREHSEMVLKENQIGCFQVNWEDKPNNIKRIADKLNIGLDSMVFVDDSIAEIKAVKETVPEVVSILFRHDIRYEKFSCFNLKNDVDRENIEKRNATYRTNELRYELKEKYNDSVSYINALGIVMDIHEAMPNEYSRISELTQRTNKCTNGKRYTLSDLRRRITSNEVKLYSVYVSDCFSDLGLVGAIEIENDTISLFSLSCRAFGREIEKKMIKYISECYRISKIEFVSTTRNDSLKTLLSDSFPMVVFLKIK